MPDPRGLLVCLLDYIKEQAKEIDPRGFVIGATNSFVRQRRDLAGLPGVEFDLHIEADHVWLRVSRLAAESPPNPPESHKAFLRISPNPDGLVPALDETASNRELKKKADALRFDGVRDEDEIARVEEHWRATANRVLESYTASWTSWAASERMRRRTISLYGDLFALMHQMEAEQTGKPHELVWGIGISSWRLSYDKGTIPFEYPLITQAIEISLDEQSMALELRPRATDTRVEFDAIIACRIGGAVEIEQAAIEQLGKRRERPVTPFDPGSYTHVLKLVARNLDGEGEYREILAIGQQVPAPGDHLVVTDGWVILSRPRTTNYLLDDLKRLQDRLHDDCPIPDGPASLVSPPSDQPIEFEPISFRGLSSRGHSGGSKAVEELYFPLPYNDEQVTIVQKLSHAAGVTVQGPPGTGKTHTIANVICHYLARGQRVLVTSRGDAALSVLQEKIPEEVRALTVALLASDREGVRQFQASIEMIQRRLSQLNPELTQEEVARCQSTIEGTHSELISIDRRVNEIALQQLSDIDVDGVPMRAQKLAELVLSGMEEYGWFDDILTLSPENAPPFSDDDAGRLRESRRALGRDLVYVQASVPSADSFLSVSDLTALHEALVQRDSIEAEVQRGELLALKAHTPDTFERARTLLALTEEAIGILDDVEGCADDWPLNLRVKCRQATFASERSALESLLLGLDAFIDARAEFLRAPVTFPEEGLSSTKTLEAIDRAVRTGKPFGILSVGVGDARRNIASVRIAGRSPSSVEEWAHVQRYVRIHKEALDFSIRWNELKDLLGVLILHGGVSSLRHIEAVATTAQKAHRLATHHDVLLAEQAREVFRDAPSELLTGNRRDLESIRRHLVRQLALAELSQAAMQLSDFQAKLAGKSGPVVDDLRAFLADTLGNSDFQSPRVASRYVELMAELRRVAALSSKLSFVRDYARRVEGSGAPGFAFRICTTPVSASGEDTGFPVIWRDAWNWARVRTHLERIEGRTELLTLAARRRELETSLARLYREMVAKAAWLAMKKKASPRVLQALAGYAIAVRRIGHGTGPNATRYRRDARQAMFDAAGAIPCWIMNHSRISEAMPADIGMFDLVIVDEASQSDLWALPAILRGKKILVVGDDKQVSPDGGFIDSKRIQELRDRFLSNQPYAAEMTPEKSLYDLAARVFAAYQVMLREHFRCVPPIIAYSNRTFYQNQIQPLRIPRASERIEPPLVDIYVEGGIRDRQDRNDREALAIAEEINAILRNEQFRGRTIGVVSLLGSDQAKHIDLIVTQRCDAAELRRRKFLCGDARTFQGSERHIMFLSLVVDPISCKAISGNMFDQRFNVAASRARDRMYLVRSVQRSDLSDKDLRTGLLAHFDRPMVVDETEAELLIDRCESGFERQVYLELTSRGYRVTPQVRTGAYRIDMVVEGNGDLRLAIECDGDGFHGADRWQHDMHRQRVLERAGWTFWRCFASTWTLRKDEVVEELVQRLNAMGLEPMGAIERSTRLVDKRIWPHSSDSMEPIFEQPAEALPAVTCV